VLLAVVIALFETSSRAGWVVVVGPYPRFPRFCRWTQCVVCRPCGGCRPPGFDLPAHVGSSSVPVRTPWLRIALVVSQPVVVVGLDSPALVLQPSRISLSSLPCMMLLPCLASPSSPASFPPLSAPRFYLVRAHILLERGGAAEATTSLLRDPRRY